MLPKRYRLSPLALPKVRGTRIVISPFQILLFPTSAPYSRFGIALRGGVAKNAVVRNRMRRAFYLVAQSFLESFPRRDVLFTVEPSARSLTPQAFRDALISAFQRVSNQ